MKVRRESFGEREEKKSKKREREENESGGLWIGRKKETLNPVF
jgi:hypothetical protein